VSYKNCGKLSQKVSKEMKQVLGRSSKFFNSLATIGKGCVKRKTFFLRQLFEESLIKSAGKILEKNQRTTIVLLVILIAMLLIVNWNFIF
jgi:hypothetical protein